MHYSAPNAIEADRYANTVSTFTALRRFIEGRDVLDYGASDGLSMCALLECGARSVKGIEPELARVERGKALFNGSLLHVEDTRHIPFADGQFDVVTANAVVEHIPQPRADYLREMWRVLRTGGFLIINETPNKYLPLDYHTTGLWFLNWLPKSIALRYALARGKWNGTEDWEHSGWRGLGQRELFSALGPLRDVSPKCRLRHHVIGQILDPYPTWVLEKL